MCVDSCTAIRIQEVHLYCQIYIRFHLHIVWQSFAQKRGVLAKTGLLAAHIVEVQDKLGNWQCWASYSNNVIYYSLLVTPFKSNIVTLLITFWQQ